MAASQPGLAPASVAAIPPKITSPSPDYLIPGYRIASISADKLTAGTIDASVITVTKLNASNITTGTLDASLVTVTNLNAANVTTGLLNVSRLNITGIVLSGFTWTDNSPGAGQVAWSSGTLVYLGTTYAISAGNAAAGNKYIYWQKGVSNTTFQSAIALPSFGDNDFLIATNVSGVHSLAFNNASAVQAVTASQIADLAVTSAKIASLDAGKITTGTLSAITIDGGASFTDSLGTFYPIVINAAGDVTVNSSDNHKTSLMFHNTKTSLTNMAIGSIGIIGGNQTLAAFTNGAGNVPMYFGLWDRNDPTAANGFDFLSASTNLGIWRRLSGVATQIYAYPGDNWLGNITGNAATVGGFTITKGVGSMSVATGAPGFTTANPTYGHTYSAAPAIILSLTSATGGYQAYYQLMAPQATTTTTGFQIVGYNWSSGATLTLEYSWIAIGT